MSKKATRAKRQSRNAAIRRYGACMRCHTRPKERGDWCDTRPKERGDWCERCCRSARSTMRAQAQKPLEARRCYRNAD